MLRRTKQYARRLPIRLLLSACLVPLPVAVAPATAQTSTAVSSREQGLASLRAVDQRVADVGYRLDTAAVALCPDKSPQTGIVVHDLSEYAADWRDAATHLFGLHDHPAVLVVAANSPAARAGVRPDDAILAINGKDVPASDSDSESYDATRAVDTLIAAAAASGHVTLRLERAGQPLTLSFDPTMGCATQFAVGGDGSLDASANGSVVIITSKLASYPENDAQLATILAHELSHNILHHPQRLKAAHVDFGLLSIFGRNARLINQTEKQADRLSVYVMDRAGYPLDAMIRFWERYRKDHGQGIFASPTHPGEKARIEILTKEIAKVRADHAAGVTPMPEKDLYELR